MKRFFGVLLACTAVLTVSCTPPPEVVEEAPPVDLVAEEAAAKTVIDQFSQIWITEDMNLVSQVFAQDSDVAVFGTDAAEIWIGYDTFTTSLEEQFTAYEDTEVMTRDQVVTVNSGGDVAWFREIADWHVTAGGERAEINGMRITGVLEKRDGAWLIVQMHVSVPVSGQVVAY